jgi:hypothetical protein
MYEGIDNTDNGRCCLQEEGCEIGVCLVCDREEKLELPNLWNRNMYMGMSETGYT